MEDLAPALASALGRLVRSPGANLNWVGPVLRRFERDFPDSYERFRRLYGLSLKIASLAAFSPQDVAVLGPATLFTALLELPPAHTASGSWLRYLHERPWAQLALQAASAAQEVSGSSADSRVAAAVTTAAIVDNEAVIRSANMLRALRAVRALAGTPEMSRLAELLWTERGQSICDLHTRHGGKIYTIDPAEFRERMRLLEGERKPSPDSTRMTQTRGAPPAAPPAARSETRKPPSPAAATSDAFERRKRAVAGAHSLREAFGLPAAERAPDVGAEPAHTVEEQKPPAAPPPVSPPSQRSGDREPLATIEATPAPSPVRPSPEIAPTPSNEERSMNDATMTASPTELDAHLTASVEELRQRLNEVERLAVEGQQTLAKLAPTIAGFAAVVAEFESVLNRWRGGRSDAV